MSVAVEPLSLAAGTQRERQLLEWFRQHGSVLIGFSGGVDSSYLAVMAQDALGSERVLAVIGRSASYPEEQWTQARNVAAQFSIPVLEIPTDEIDDPQYAANPINRCYFCKGELWRKLSPIARERGLAVVVDGTNADDLVDYRPGSGAAREFGVRSPLAELGLSKADVRERSRLRGIPTWSHTSSPCLSSRIPYGTPVTRQRLREVETAESGLRALGIGGNLRVRHHGELGRVELDSARVDEWLAPERRAMILAVLRSAGFNRVAMDLRGFRSGSLNVLEGLVR
jgi:uncharacterized protein